MKNKQEFLTTAAGEQLPSGAAVWQEHPNPMLRRETWLSLNGEWMLNSLPVRVPFPPQSALSGYKGEVGDVLHYEKQFILPDGFAGGRVLSPDRQPPAQLVDKKALAMDKKALNARIGIRSANRSQ